MFERIVIRSAVNADGKLDAGKLAEAILYYGQVHLLLNYGMLRQVCQTIGAPILLRLLSSGYVRATFMADSEAIATTSAGSRNMHTFIQIQNARKDSNVLPSVRDVIAQALAAQGYNGALIKKLSRDLSKRMPKAHLNDGNSNVPFIQQFADEVRRAPDLLAQARMVLEEKLPGKQSGQVERFRIEEDKLGQFFVNTDLNWSAVETDYRRLYGPDAPAFGPADVLGLVQSGFVDTGLAARYGTELLTSDLGERLVTGKVAHIVKTRQRSTLEISTFSEKVLGSSFALRDTINSGQRTFEEFLDVIDKSRKWKSMLVGLNPDVGLLGSYNAEIAKDSWLASLLPKPLRFSFFTGAGLALDALTGVPVAGVALGAFDYFILDKIGRGWRPNTFIDNSLLPFLQNDDRRQEP